MKIQFFSLNHKLYSLKSILIFTFCCLMISCATPIRQSTVQLSTDIGNRIAEMEKLHQLAIQKYFDVEISKVENFLTNTWEPLFLKNFLGTSQVLAKLQTASRIDESIQNQISIVFEQYLTDTSEVSTATEAMVTGLNTSRRNEDGVVRRIVNTYVPDGNVDAATIEITSLLGTDDPARIIFEFTEAAHIEMNNRRKSLLAPIEQARAETVSQLNEAYGQLINGQSTITGRLEAANKVSKEREEVLNSLGLSKVTASIQSKLSKLTTKVDGALSEVNSITSSGNAGDIISTLEDKLKSIQTSN